MNPFRSLQHQLLRKAVDAPKGSGARLDKDVPLTMRDGVVLLHDHWIAVDADPARPVVLIRTPYGTSIMGSVGRLFAEQGFHVVMQNVRGVFGSGGEFNPMFNEEADGLDTIAWIERQPWYGGVIHTWGLSYLGMTQWALAARLPESVKRMTIAVSARSFRDSVIRPGDGFGLETAVTWAKLLATQEGPLLERLRSQFGARSIASSCDVVPPSDAVPEATGRRMRFVDDWLAHGIADPWWEPVVFAQDLRAVPPTTQVAGWYDLFINDQIADVEALQDTGRPTRLVVGPWTHTDLKMLVESVREALLGLTNPADADRRPAVRIQPIGSKQWLTFDAWPPPSVDRTYHCQPGGALAEAESPEAVMAYRYDPADPTPAAGGGSLNQWTAGRKNQEPRESRDDVLTWTSEPMPADTLLAGNVRMTVRFVSTNPRCDLFVRVCEVDDSWRSFNLADGYQRLSPGDEGDDPRDVQISFPIGAAIKAGHRLRLQISSGAHPLHMRNPGTSEPVNDFSELVASDQEVHLGPGATSVVVPVVPTRPVGRRRA